MLKGLCRSFSFLLTAWYIALLVKKVDGNAFIYIPLLFGLGFTAWYGWSDKDGH